MEHFAQARSLMQQAVAQEDVRVLTTFFSPLNVARRYLALAVQSVRTPRSAPSPPWLVVIELPSTGIIRHCRPSHRRRTSSLALRTQPRRRRHSIPPSTPPACSGPPLRAPQEAASRSPSHLPSVRHTVRLEIGAASTSSPCPTSCRSACDTLRDPTEAAPLQLHRLRPILTTDRLLVISSGLLRCRRRAVRLAHRRRIEHDHQDTKDPKPPSEQAARACWPHSTRCTSPHLPKSTIESTTRTSVTTRRAAHLHCRSWPHHRQRFGVVLVIA